MSTLYKKYCYLFLCLVIFPFLLAAQDSTLILPFTKKQAAVLDFMEFKFQSGAYEEVIRAGTKECKKVVNESIDYQTRLKVLIALSYHILLNTDYSDKFMSEQEAKILASPEKTTTSISLLSLARYYEQTNDFVKATSVIEKADSILKGSKSFLLKHELLIHKSILTSNLGFYTTALEIIALLENEVFISERKKDQLFKEVNNETDRKSVV